MNGHICLTFDFDAISIWLQREMLTMTPISRGEFGAAAVPRILRMLEERGIRSTWFIPGHTMETYPDLCAAVHEHGHEIGLHGYAHENFNILESGAELAILERTIGIVERITGVRPKGFRSPSWDLSARTVGHLRDLGIVYDSSLMGNDYAPYRCRLGDRLCKEGPVVFGQETSIVELPVSWSLDDYPYFEYVRLPHAIMHGLGNPAELYANWTADAAYMLRDFEEGVMTVTLHPQVSGRGHRLLALEAGSIP
jgi:peptidoglycan/xylan/chitin deacetylase (PgdA/CDA1 family)